MKRILLVISGFIIVVVFISWLLSIKIGSKYNKVDRYHKQKINEYYLYSGWLEIGFELAKKNNDWSKLPLSKRFREKYNEKDGILGKIEFDSIKYRPYANTDKQWYFKDYYTYFVITQGKRQFAYRYDIKHEKGYENWVDDIEIFDIIEIVDENGNEKEVKRKFDGDDIENKMINIDYLLMGDIFEKSIAVTEKFHSKYPIFLDLFIHYSPLSFNHMRLLSEESDLDNNIAIIKVDSILECKERKYKVKLILDEKLYLDDCEVELLEEKEYTGRRENSDNATAKALYLHSNLEDINLTDEFKVRLKKEGSYFDDIDKIDINDIGESTYIGDERNEKIVCYRMKDGTINSYYRKYVIDDDKKISNIISKKLEYTNMTSKEVAELYLESNKN